MKKLLLTMGTVAAVAAPIAAVVSCGDKDVVVKLPTFNAKRDTSNADMTNKGEFLQNDKTLDAGMMLGYPPYDFKLTNKQAAAILDGGLKDSKAKSDEDMLALEKNMIAKTAAGGYGAGLDVYIANMLQRTLVKKDGTLIYNDVLLHGYNGPDPLVAAGLNKEYDMMIAGMSENASRDKVFSFTTNYFEAENGFLVHSADKTKYKTAAEIKAAGVPVIALSGTTQGKAAEAYFGKDHTQLVKEDSTAVQELATQANAVYLIESPVGTNSKHAGNAKFDYLSKSNGNFDVSAVGPIPSGSQIALAKSDDAKAFVKSTLNAQVDALDKKGTDIMAAAIDIYDHLA